MASVYKERQRWSVSWYASDGKRRTRRGLPTRAMAKQVGEKQEYLKQAARHGLATAAEERRARNADITIAEHLEKFRRRLIDKGDTVAHADESESLCARVFDAAGVDRLDQIDRDLIRSTLASLKTKLKGGKLLSLGRRNKIQAAVKAFTAWLFDSGRLSADPLARLPQLDADRALTRVRIALTDAQAVAVFESTLRQPTRGGMTGVDRAMRYAIGFGTGFRQGTLFALTIENFDLDGGMIRVEARHMKGRRAVEHPIAPALIALLRPWLAAKPGARPIFPRLPHAKPIKAWRRDLEAAGLVYHEPGTNRYCDLHSQRNSFITWMLRGGGIAVAQALAHHSTPVLTARYGRLGDGDYAKALRSVPTMQQG